jgi:UDP-glucose 4-epimerase
MLFNRVAKNSLRVIRRSPVGPDELIVKQTLMDLDFHQGFRLVILRYFNAAGADGRKIAASLVTDTPARFCDRPVTPA